MRSITTGIRLAAALALAATSLVAVPASAEVQPRALWWKNCANYNLTDHCVESVEYFDDVTKTWIKATAEKNPLYEPREITNEDRAKYASGDNEQSQKCGYGRQLNLDTCYRIPGAASDGSEQILQTLIYGETEDLKLSFEATNGPVVYVRPGTGDSMYGVRENSLWRVTVISDVFGVDAGIAYAQMKEPTLDVFKGADGHWRVQASGRVQSIYAYEAREPGQPTCDDSLRQQNELQANDLRRPFSINVSRYKYEFEKLKGSPPAGAFITNNGGCHTRLQFDQTNRIISVLVGGPHYDTNGKVIDGWVEASIRGDLIRKAFNAEPKTMNQAIVEVTYADGTSQNATSTTKYIAATDKVEIRAYGFHYSEPTVKLKLQPVQVAQTTKQGGKPTFTCVKGKSTRQFVGKCPAGWKKK